MTDYVVLEALLLSHLEQIIFLSNESVLKYAEVKGRTRLPERIKGTCRFLDKHAYNTQPVKLYYTFFFLQQKVSTIIFIEEY